MRVTYVTKSKNKRSTALKKQPPSRPAAPGPVPAKPPAVGGSAPKPPKVPKQ